MKARPGEDLNQKNPNQIFNSLMACPTLDDLPSPPPGTTGWPWTEQSEPLPDTQPDGTPWPKISVVTPSYNQGRFIEETIRSVLLQRYPNLEYVVMDGGSTDGTVEILEKYDPWIDEWLSEPDEGQSAAINKGFSECCGKLATWINSDDMLAPEALGQHMRQVGYEPETIYVGDCRFIDVNGNTLEIHTSRVHSFEDLVDIPNVWSDQSEPGQIVQMETLFSLSNYKSIGGLNENLKYTMDYDLWGRLLMEGAEIEYTGIETGIFREHDSQKTSNAWSINKNLIENAIRLIRSNEEWSTEKKHTNIRSLKNYEERIWMETGRLAKTRLPRGIVIQIRDILDKIRR